ncbi:MAG: hypothetical protein CSA81_09440 [Acidobacteria bacterium]|nr:MAG: hypothetical protein CSA81_09440 [Acidobacteriota bacterium]
MVHFERATPHFIEKVQDIIELLKPKLHTVSDGDRKINGFEVDSRKIKPGQVFIAVPGARVDGHSFVVRALEKGASACLISRKINGDIPPGCIWVQDTVIALDYLAAAHRRSLNVKLIAITGSVGKTTTKELLYNLLAPHFYTKKSEGNFNSTIGLPMQILRLERSDEVMIAEMGMSYPGEIRTLMRIASPDIALWTSVKRAHLANFDSIEDIARAKAEMVEELGQDKTLIYNADDPLVTKHAMTFGGRKVSYGFMSPVADVCGQISAFADWEGTNFKVDYSDGQEGNYFLSAPGKYNIHNALACCSVAWLLSLKQMDFSASFKRGVSIAGRSQLQIYDGDVFLVDDSYNASPFALAQVIRCFCGLSEKNYRWIVVGDMLEQGRHEVGIHRVLGHELASADFDRVTFVGDLVRHSYDTFRQFSDGNAQVEHFGDVQAARQITDAPIPEHSRIWIKGSRAIGLEHIAQAFTARLENRDESVDTSPFSLHGGTDS